jgi:hypothetical protein
MTSVVRWAAALPDLALSFTFLSTWIAPQLLGADKARYAMQLMVLEFIVVHSAAFVGFVGMRSKSRLVNGASVVGVSALYSVLVWAISTALHAWWPLISFWSLTANRLASLVLTGRPDDSRMARLASRWVLSALLYIGWVFVTIFLPIPRLGLDPSILPAAPGQSGLWVDQPQRVLVAGAGYFLCQALLDLRPVTLANPRPARSVYEPARRRW